MKNTLHVKCQERTNISPLFNIMEVETRKIHSERNLNDKSVKNVCKEDYSATFTK